MAYQKKRMQVRFPIKLIVLIVIALSVFSCTRESKQKLIVEFDCTKEYPASTYFSHGNVHLASSATGQYREAEAVPLSRFGYRFSVKNIGKPYLAVVRYPDDKRRFMCMMDGTTYDMTIGVFTGVNQPITNKMLEIRKVFWPRWNDCSIVFMTWGTGEPAAVADIKIYELAELPALKINSPDDQVPKRELGLQFEDPCGTSYSMGAINDQEWLDRTAGYMRYTGQKLLTYPIVWYHGPIYPSDREPSGYFGVVAGRDRNLYCRWTAHPEDWVASLLKKFEKEGLEFQAALTLLRLGSLMQNMNVDLNSIKEGKDTYNNMLWNDHVQASAQDWTTEYNVQNYEKKANGTLKEWAYGENGGPYGKGVMFNPLHPTVQNAILGIIQEIVDRYGQSPAFKGISMNMWHATMTWFFSLKSGYDDYTIGLFEKETGIMIPVDPKAPDRFSKRYEFLTKKHSETWINWRCEKIRELHQQMRDIIIKARPDLRLTITMWTETSIPGWFGVPEKPEHQILARKSLYELYREGGFDVNLYRNEPGIEIDYSMVPSRDRDGWGTSGTEMPLEKTCSFRDHDFLDQTTLNAVGAQKHPGAFIFDSWVEAWGKNSWFPCDPNEKQAKDLKVMNGKPAEGICRINSEYPKDDFWWDSQLRITPPFQGSNHYLEYFAHALAELDACRITRGGLFTDTGHAEQMQNFAKAYRALPAEKFETVGTSTDPVAVRTLVSNGKHYLYLVNREYYPVKVKLKFGQESNQLTDLASGKIIKASTELDLTIGPYELRSFEMLPKFEITGFSATVPAEIASQLNQQLVTATVRLENLIKAKIDLPVGSRKLLSEIETALKEGRYAWARRALNSYPVRKADELAQVLSSNRKATK
jgi:hypothetical protein